MLMLGCHPHSDSQRGDKIGIPRAHPTLGEAADGISNAVPAEIYAGLRAIQEDAEKSVVRPSRIVTEVV